MPVPMGVETLDRTPLQVLREPHPQQAAIDAECARLLLATARQSVPGFPGFARRGVAYTHRPSNVVRRRLMGLRKTPRPPALD